jgi:hypothetical protein
MKDHSRSSALFMGAASLAVTVGLKVVAAAVPDPIYEVIEAHRKAALAHHEAGASSLLSRIRPARFLVGVPDGVDAAEAVCIPLA